MKPKFTGVVQLKQALKVKQIDNIMNLEPTPTDEAYFDLDS